MTKKVEKKKQENYAAPIICAIVIVVALLAVVVATVATINSGNKKNDDQSQVEDSEALKDIDNQGVLDFLEEKKTGFLYVGRPTCPSCAKFAPLLTELVETENYTAYYYDTDEASSDKDLKTEVLGEIGVTSVPTFMYIKDGVEIERMSSEDMTDKDAIKAFIEKYL